MNIAILLFDRFTALDAVGPYEVLQRMPGAELKFVAREKGPVRTETRNLALTADATLAEVVSADILVVPGGPGQSAIMEDKEILDWIRLIDSGSKWTTSVCTGSLLLGAAGLLKGLRATSHWLALEILREFGAEPTGERVVVQGKVVTAAGVSAGIDMALRLVALECGEMQAQAIQLGIEYDPQPPFNAGSPATCPTPIVEMLRQRSRFILQGR